MKLIQEIQAIPSTPKDLRKFGLTMGIFFGILGGLFLWRGKAAWSWWTGLSAFFLFFGILLPGWLKGIHRAWMTLALLMGWVMTRVVLIIFFYIVLTPIGFFARLSGKRPLGLRSEKGKVSYWIDRAPVTDKTHYEKQY